MVNNKVVDVYTLLYKDKMVVCVERKVMSEKFSRTDKYNIPTNNIGKVYKYIDRVALLSILITRRSLEEIINAN